MTNINELFSLTGKSAFISGATGYLGHEMTWALAKAGAEVFVNGRNIEKCQKLAEDIVESGFSAVAAPFDVSDVDQIEAFFAELGSAPLHILVNNAYSGAAGTIETSGLQDYIESYSITVGSAQEMMRCALPQLRSAVSQSGEASIINISSMYGLVSPDLKIYASASASNPPFYGAAKAALLQLTRYAAIEFGPEGIRVNAICPGPFPPKELARDAESFFDQLARKSPMGRVGSASEMAGPVLFLSSSASSYVNGATLQVDGGWTAW